MGEPIRATVLIDADALRAGRGDTADRELLDKLAGLLVDVRDRLTAETAILVDGRGAERLTGLSEKTLRNHGCPHVKIGSSIRWRPEALREWARAREQQALSAQGEH